MSIEGGGVLSTGSTIAWWRMFGDALLIISVLGTLVPPEIWHIPKFFVEEDAG